MSATPDSTLANPEQRLADLERQLAECRAERDEAQQQLAERTMERDEANAQQTATAEVLQVINSSPGDLAPVFDAILEKAHSVCGASLGALVLYDGEQLRAAATRGYPEQYAALIRKGVPPDHVSAFQRLREGERVVHVRDAAALLSLPPVTQAAVEIGGVRTSLSIPLRREGVLLGYISAQRGEVRAYSDREIALLENFAAQAVMAIENARLLTETREALEQQTATAEVLQVINSSPGDLAPVFDVILKKAHAVCGSSHGALFLSDGERFMPAAMSAPELLPTPLRQGGMGSDAPLVRPLLAGEPFVHILDLRLVDHPLAQAAVAAGVRTLLSAPLRKGGTLIGMINAARFEVHPFSEKQIALLQNFAAQAVIAIENARLLTETREALEQQTATAEVLQVINSSPGNLQPVFDAMLEKATRLCEANFGILFNYEDKCFQVAALYGVPDAYGAYLTRKPLNPGPQTALGRVARGEDLIAVVDSAADDVYNAGDPLRRARVELGGARSAVTCALRKDEALLGVFTIYRQEVRPFSEKQIALLQNFAAQAVIAMENARLLGELSQRTYEVAELNRGLEARVAEQVDELGRVGRLKRFLAPQLAELIVSQGDEKILESHRREIVVVFCDLRGYTAFTETAEPEEVLDFLREYHGALGPLVSQFEDTLDQFSGDGIMVFFNDPVPCLDPAERAVKMAMAMREVAGALIASWRRRGRLLGFGAGIAQGYATLGQIGFAERSGYTAIGTVCNLAARLCAEAQDGQILIGQRVAVAVEETITLEEVGALTLKGLTQPVVAYNVPHAATQPALRVIEGGPQSV